MKDQPKDINLVSTEKGNLLFPIFLKLEQLRLLIIGGGKVGLEKLLAVVNNAPGTSILLVATRIGDPIKKLAEQYPALRLEERPYAPADLDEIDIAIVAVDDRSLSETIYADAKKRDKLVNVADTPELCDFYLSAVVKKGNLKIAISTNGKSPTIAKRLKETLADALPEELDQVLDHMQTIRGRLNGNFEYKVKRLNALTRKLAENENSEKEQRWKKIATRLLLVFSIMLVGHFVFSYLPYEQIKIGTIDFVHTLDRSFPLMILAGFIAQMVDGALGMGYGVTSATILLSVGVNPAAISGSIHTAEMFASGASGYSHYKFGNVNKKLFKALLIPGVLGAIAGAVVLVFLGDKYGNYVRPLIAGYTLLLGIKFIINAFRTIRPAKKFRHYKILAGVGGFFDSFGGGGWGPIVTSTLINNGRSHKYVVGSVSLTEFFVTLASAFTFFTLIGVSHWQAILGLIIGGLVAAPVAARLAGKLPRRTAFLLLGCLIIFWSVKILIKIF